MNVLMSMMTEAAMRDRRLMMVAVRRRFRMMKLGINIEGAWKAMIMDVGNL